MSNKRSEAIRNAGYYGACCVELEKAGLPCPIYSNGHEPAFLFRFANEAVRKQFLDITTAGDYPSNRAWQLGHNGDVTIPAPDMPELFERLTVWNLNNMRERHRKMLAERQERVRQAGLIAIGARP